MTTQPTDTKAAMVEKNPLITADRVRELFAYDPETGVLTHRTWRVGSSAGALKEGYVSIQVGRRNYKAHRLVWLYVHGEWPKHQIDHINGDGTDNRIANLRDVSASLNQQNKRKSRRDSTIGFLGVKAARNNLNQYDARITIPGGPRKHLGTFPTPEAAHGAYLEAKRKLHEGCTI